MTTRGSNDGALLTRALGLVRSGKPVAVAAREVGVTRGRLRRWMDGSSAPPVEQQEPPPFSERAPKTWPPDAQMPATYVRRRALPCVSCRRVLLNTGGAAVMVTGIPRGTTAYLRCKSCGARWSLPVEER